MAEQQWFIHIGWGLGTRFCSQFNFIPAHFHMYNNADKAIAIAMIVVSVVIVLPVAGPVALIMYIALKKLGRDGKTS